MRINRIIRLLAMSVLLLSAKSLQAAEEKEVLRVVYFMDGSEVGTAFFSFEDNPQVVFDDGTIYVTSSQSSATYQIDDVVELFFDVEEQVATHLEEGIFEAGAPDILFRMLGGDLVKVVGKDLTPDVSVYTSDGKSVDVPTDYTPTEINIRLGALPRGLYIIKTNQQSFKFIRK